MDVQFNEELATRRNVPKPPSTKKQRLLMIFLIVLALLFIAIVASMGSSPEVGTIDPNNPHPFGVPN